LPVEPKRRLSPYRQPHSGGVNLNQTLAAVNRSASILFLEWLAKYFVYKAVFHCLFSAKIKVSVGVVGNLLHRLTGVLSYDVTYRFLHPHDFSGGNFNICRLPLSTTNCLV
jgi:hypothetical protein